MSTMWFLMMPQLLKGGIVVIRRPGKNVRKIQGIVGVHLMAQPLGFGSHNHLTFPNYVLMDKWVVSLTKELVRLHANNT